MAKRARPRLRELLETAGNQWRAWIAIGVAGILPLPPEPGPAGQEPEPSSKVLVASTEASGEHTLEALVRDADAALYRAKAAGRNCVVSSPSHS